MFDIVLENGNLITMNNNNEILYNKDIMIFFLNIKLWMIGNIIWKGKLM